MNLFLRVFDSSYWTDNGGSLSFQGLLSSNTTFFKVNPLTIQSLGGTKFSTLNPADIKSQLKLDAVAPDLSVQNSSEYLFASWASAGWDAQGDLIGEVGAWALNNFVAPELQPVGGEINLIVLYGVVSGSYYALPLVYTGNSGDTDFPIDGGTFLNTSFPKTVDGGQFTDTSFSPIIDGGSF